MNNQENIIENSNTESPQLENDPSYIFSQNLISGTAHYFNWVIETYTPAVKANAVWLVRGTVINSALEVPEVVDGFQNGGLAGGIEESAGLAANVAGFWAGATAAGVLTSYLNVAPGPGTAANVLLSIAGGITGAIVGEKVVEDIVANIPVVASNVDVNSALEIIGQGYMNRIETEMALANRILDLLNLGTPDYQIGSIKLNTEASINGGWPNDNNTANDNENRFAYMRVA